MIERAFQGMVNRVNRCIHVNAIVSCIFLKFICKNLSMYSVVCNKTFIIIIITIILFSVFRIENF